jgi:hypothetical protein
LDPSPLRKANYNLALRDYLSLKSSPINGIIRLAGIRLSPIQMKMILFILRSEFKVDIYNSIYDFILFKFLKYMLTWTLYTLLDAFKL